MMQNLQKQVNELSDLGSRDRPVQIDRESKAYQQLAQKFMVENEKIRTDMTLIQQKSKISDAKQDEFQEEVYKTV